MKDRRYYQNQKTREIRRLMSMAMFMSIVICAAAYGVRSQDIPCPGVTTQRVTYMPVSGYLYTNELDSRTNPNDTDHEVRLVGSLHFKRIGTETIKNRPVLIYNHGHEQKRGEACAIVSYFVGQKWVVFTPLRRGHFLDINDNDDPSDDIRSTGIYIDNYISFCSRSFVEARDDPDFPTLKHLYCGSGFCRPGHPCDADNWRSGTELAYLREQRFDIRDQIAYIKSLPAFSTEVIGHTWKLADANSIVIMGHSYGGALTVMTNAHDYGQSVAIDIAGAELSWDNEDEPFWAGDLSDAMRFQKRPIFIFQALNGKYLSPTKELFKIGVNHESLVQASMFPRVPACTDSNSDGLCDNDTDTTVFKDIHGKFVGQPSQVAIWGPAVVEFMKRHPRP